jgi:hypothetical protein
VVSDASGRSFGDELLDEGFEMAGSVLWATWPWIRAWGIAAAARAVASVTVGTVSDPASSTVRR